GQRHLWKSAPDVRLGRCVHHQWNGIVASCTKAVILARGLGTRMRSTADGIALAPDQASAADSGLKAMIPVGQPFLDYALSGLADAGFREVCIVVAPEHTAIRDRYTRTVVPTRIRVAFAVQLAPIGTANAVLAAEPFAGGEPFVVLNADNYYPTDVLARLRNADGCAGVAFTRAGLLRSGDIPPERIASYAILDVDDDGFLRHLIDKPDHNVLAHAAASTNERISMNCWRITSEMLRACREVRLSRRGELELPAAVQYAVDTLGIRIRMLPADAAVLDLSQRSDVATVAQRLQSVTVHL
ncbi:MAG TPA: sugar phosphate nucleotidyltransferase, partial [Gemmatimonadaceae bacterium]|nr:sugar phosphate nucleotidyltransferase [Gemmatimonadaceae bacterium]